MLSHRSGIASWLAGLLFLGLGPLLMFAQDSAPKSQTNQRTVTNPLLVNVTGCLKKNSTTGGYYVADQNGTDVGAHQQEGRLGPAAVPRGARLRASV